MLIRHPKHGAMMTKLQRQLSGYDWHRLVPRQQAMEALNGLLPFERDILPQLRMEALELSEFGCDMCGAEPGDTDPCNPGYEVRLHVDYAVPVNQGGQKNIGNLRVFCSNCNLGRSNIEQPSESELDILARLRRVPRSVQKEVYEALKKTFGDA